jgi:exonuclease SbcD
MKFIHFADAHLDSPFRGLSFLPQGLFNKIKNAANESLAKIVDLALKEDVDLVLIAGDTFDSPQPTPGSQVFFAKQVKRLTDAEIQVAMVLGNHDYLHAQDLLVAQSPFFHLLGPGQVEQILLQTKTGFEYEVNGYSYQQNHVTTNVMAKMQPKGARFAFGLLHANLETGQEGVYCPFTQNDLERLNYDYFALGHIHHRRIISEKPLAAYPGNIQGRQVNELGDKGCLLGSVDEQTGAVSLAFKATSDPVWLQKEVTLTQAVPADQLQKELASQLADSNDNCLIDLKVNGAQNLTDAELENLQSPEFWQLLSGELPGQTIIDAHFYSNEQLVLDERNAQALAEAEKTVLTQDELTKNAKALVKKAPWLAEVLNQPDFQDQVFAQTKLLLQKQWGGSDEA